MNTNTHSTPEVKKAQEELLLLGTKAATSIVGGVLSFILEAITKDSEEKYQAILEKRRATLRDKINSGEQMSLYEMGVLLDKYNWTKEQIAEEIDMPVGVVKNAIRPWWKLF